MAKSPRKRSRKSVKEAADRAVARSVGEPVSQVAPVLDAKPARAPAHTPHPEPEQPVKPASRRGKSKTLGRRHTYTAALGKAICNLLADGMTLTSICRRPGMPSDRTVRTWALDDEHPFSPQYTRARAIGYDRMSDDTIDISDDSRNDWVWRDDDGEKVRVIDPETVARSRLKVDTRKWLLSKMLPKVYGDKVTATVNPGDGFADVWRLLTVSPQPETHAHA